jgi:flagellar hook-basal body complex protein FliE
VTLPIGAVQGVLNVVGGPSAGAAGSRALAAGEASLGAVEAGASGGNTGIAGPAGPSAMSLEGTSGVGSLNATSGVQAGEAGSGLGGEAGTGGGFGEALTSAISQLEGTQQSASAAAQALATGNTSDPEAAVVTVADAQLAMQLASQLRTKGTEALQQIFQTQV